MITRLRQVLLLPLRYRLWRPEHLALIGRDLAGGRDEPEGGDRDHLDALIGWLGRAQDRRDHAPDAGGVSAGWSFEDGWLPSYPETSGYIVETFLAAARVLGREELAARARRIIDWELSIQNPDGSFPGHFGEAGSRPVIFNTGQIMHGMIAGYVQLGRDDCLAAAVRAGEWLVERQDGDGCWRRSVHNGIPHVYNTRTAWALLNTGLIVGERRFVAAAVRNFEWALTQATPSGWFAQNAFRDGEAPFTHTIAYAMRGLLEGGLACGEPRFVAAAAKAARALAQCQREDGWIAGAFADGWRPVGDYACLTGIAQIALNWQRLRHSGVPGDWQTHIDRAVAFLKRHHRRTGSGGPEDGGLAGSFPTWGRYSRFEFPNWAAKFFADLLMMEISGEAVPPPVRRASSTVRADTEAANA